MLYVDMFHMSGALRTSPTLDDEKRKRISTYLWFVSCSSAMRGPYTHEKLLQLLASGDFEPGDYCWRQGFHEWRAICTVDDFEFTPKPYLVKAYPEIPAPSTKNRSSAPSPTNNKNYAQDLLRKSNSNYFEQITEPKTVKVRLEHRSRFEMGLWERTAMIVFAILFAWVSTWVALSEVEKSFEDRFEKWNTGSGVEMGLNPSVVDSQTWTFQQLSPLLSAKGLLELPNLNYNVSDSMLHIVEHVSETSDPVENPWVLKSQHILQWNSATRNEKNFKHEADPIYVEPYKIHGIWSPLEPSFLKIRTLGYPGL